MRKKLGILFLCFAIFATILSGCGNSASTASASGSGASAQTPSAASQGTESKALQKYINQGYITVGTSNDVPISYVDSKTGKFTGFDGEIIQEAARRLGIKQVKVQTMDFSNLIVALNSGKIDMITDCMMIKPERLKQCYFSDYLYQNSELLVVPQNSKIKSKSDFTGKEVIGCTTGTTFLQTAQDWEKQGVIKQAKAMGDQPELLLNVQTGKIDGCLTDAFVVEYMLAQNDKMVAGLKVAEDYKPEGAAGAGYACRFEDEAVMKEFNKVFAEMRKDGFINKSLQNFGLSTKLHAITQEKAEHGLNVQ